MSLADQVAALEAALTRAHAQLALYRERLGEIEVTDVDMMLKYGVTGNEAALLRILIAHKPSAVTALHLDAELPLRDRARGRAIKTVHVLICKLRKKLGADAIQTTPAGWRINPKWGDPAPARRPIQQARMEPLAFAYGGQP